MIKQLYLTDRLDPNKHCHSGVRVDLRVMAMKSYFTFHRTKIWEVQSNTFQYHTQDIHFLVESFQSAGDTVAEL